MDQDKLLTGVMLVVILAIGFLLPNPATVNAADCRVVRIVGMAYHESVTLEPVSIGIPKGTCVIWFNNTTGAKVKIIFEEGEKVCKDVINASLDYKLDEKNCFVTATHITPLGTASLSFSKEGKYDYLMEIEGQDKKVKGRIFVK